MPEKNGYRTRGNALATMATLAVAGTIVLAAAVAENGLPASSPGSSNDEAAYASPSSGMAFTSYANQTLATVPGARLVEDEVLVVPGPKTAPSEGTPIPPKRTSPLIELPGNWYELVEAWGEGDEVPTTEDEIDGRLVADRGPAYLACTEWPGNTGCTVSLGHLEDGKFVYGLGLGSDEFQMEGSSMEVFMIPQFTLDGTQTLVIAGGATSVESAVIVLEDGKKIAATVTNGIGESTGSLYYAITTGTPARVITYGAEGRVVENHPLSECEEGEDCEVR